MKIRADIILHLLGVFFIACNSNPHVSGKHSFEKYYNEYNVTGSFVLLNLQKNEYIEHNKDQLSTQYTPASTFKICNSLIGVETGIIQNENFVIEWDSVVRSNPNWNKDTKLKEALQNSVVWYYQELATRVGKDTMKYWLDKLSYGNADTSGGVTQFWLSGGLRITPIQQIDFLKKLVEDDLPLSNRTMDIVKDIMLIEKTSNYKLFGKTGWGIQNGRDVGWFVGFLETNDNTYVFANCIQADGPSNPNFAKARKSITMEILSDLELLEQ